MSKGMIESFIFIINKLKSVLVFSSLLEKNINKWKCYNMYTATERAEQFMLNLPVNT